MKDPGINVRLTLAILAVTILPLLAAFYLVDNAVTTSLNLGFNAEVLERLGAHSQNLKKLGKLDPERLAEYRAEFESAESLRAIYGASEEIKTSVSGSLLVYFGIGIASALVLAIAVAAVLSRQISRSYRYAFAELIRQRERVRYLEEISSWQEMAKVLAHEIKNPLTPIQVLVSSLTKAYKESGTTEFEAQLVRSERMIMEELQQLNHTVNKFSDFAKLPTVQASAIRLLPWLATQLPLLRAGLNGAHIDLREPEKFSYLDVKIDAALFRRVLANILRNGVEANPDKGVRFILSMSVIPESIVLEIGNDGVPVPAELAPRIFDPYTSGTASKENMGLGLAIARKIMIEHGGDIAYRESEGRPTFSISLPRIDGDATP